MVAAAGNDLRLPVRRRSSLVPVFLVSLTVGLLLAGGGILFVVSRSLTVQAERHAIDQARLVTTAFLDKELRPADLQSPLSASRRRGLAALFVPSAIGPGFRRVTLYRSDGRLLFSTATGVRVAASERVARARGGEVVSDVVSTADGRVLRAFVPVVLRGGRGRGVIELDQSFAPIEAAARRSSLLVTGILELLLAVLAAALLPVLSRASRSLRRHVAELDWMASHDQLTGLLNRPGFRRVVEEGSAAHRGGAVLVLFDIDRFHEVNDTLGSDSADRLLAEVARRAAEAFGAHPLGRLGEDEFGLLLATPGGDRIAEIAEQLREALDEPFTIGGLRLSVESRIGAAAMSSVDDFETVIRRAGIALSKARESSRGIAMYSPSDDERDLERLTLLGDLRDAVRERQFVVHYQPQTDLASHVIRGVEALVRWQHPKRGLLLPAEFIEVAERSGLISELGRQVLGESIRQWRAWHDEGIDLEIAVNVSAVDLLDPSLVGEIMALLREHEMEPRNLILELTERSLLRNEQQTLKVLRQLRATGIRLAVDDYGTGYSSLATLRQLPVQQVKLDRRFVAGIPDDRENDEIVRSTVQLAHALNATIVAEGVETDGELDALVRHGCDIAQGYLIGEPQTAAELTELVNRARYTWTLRAATGL